MPEINFVNVLSCNSEEKQSPAENLLKPESIKKWKCKPGEKSATALLQLEKSAQIGSVDIGNEHSAFVELLVGRETAKTEDDFQVLLPACAFMNPNESRQSQNPNRVRMFSTDDLAPQVARQKWDRLKIVCTQPFNKNVGFGLAFIRLHEAGGGDKKVANAKKEDPVESGNSVLSFGKFKLKSVDKDEKEQSPTPGVMFSKRKATDDDESDTVVKTPSVSSTTASGAATAHAKKAGKKQKEEEKKERQQPAKASGSDKRKQTTESKRRSPSPKRPAKQRSRSPPAAKRAKVSTESSTSGGAKRDEKKKKPIRKVPLESLLDGVVFALSGFENPFRSELRETMTELGAKYKPDWTRDCTHLICAFANTPKYNQVKGKGKIVKKQWPLDCHKQLKRLSWRKYAFETKDRDGTDSETEELVAGEEDHKPSTSKAKESGEKQEATPTRKAAGAEALPSPPARTRSGEGKETATASAAGDDEDVYNASTDEAPSSDDDTDDEIQRVKARQAKRDKKEDVVTNNKHEQSPTKSPKKKLEVGPDGLPILPDFFKGLRFLLYGEFPPTQRRQLNRFITAFGGTVESYMGDAVTHVITRSIWDQNFDEALAENKALWFLKPDWILECGRLTDWVEPSKYVIEKP